MLRKSVIHVRSKFEAKHNWPDAPTPVAFLRDPHRHIFHVEATLPVTHDDRQLEFFMVKMEMDAFIKDLGSKQNIPNLGSQSCEMIAERILQFLMVTYQLMSGSVNVWEDGENGATVEMQSSP